MACDAEQCQEVGGVAGLAARRSGDGVAAVETQDADGEVAQAGHGPGSVAGADLVGVLGEGGVADVVQRLDAPIPSDLVGPSSLSPMDWSCAAVVDTLAMRRVLVMEAGARSRGV